MDYEIRNGTSHVIATVLLHILRWLNGSLSSLQCTLGKKWRVGDIVGALIDTDLYEIRFYLNGEDLGQAFVNFFSGEPMFPALSLNVRQSVRVNIGLSKFMCSVLAIITPLP